MNSQRAKPQTPRADPVDVSIEIHRLAAELPRYNHTFRRDDVPRNGIYLMFETGERIDHPEFEGDRIVRIGTHRGDGRLPTRLRLHFRGTRRVSVLRRHLGSALRTPDHVTPDDPEPLISDALADRFGFACIAVPELAERLALERGLIAQLAISPIGLPSPEWLGRLSGVPKIQASGLWNVHHIGGVPLTALEFERLKALSHHS